MNLLALVGFIYSYIWYTGIFCEHFSGDSDKLLYELAGSIFAIFLFWKIELWLFLFCLFITFIEYLIRQYKPITDKITKFGKIHFFVILGGILLFLIGFLLLPLSLLLFKYFI